MARSDWAARRDGWDAFTLWDPRKQWESAKMRKITSICHNVYGRLAGHLRAPLTCPITQAVKSSACLHVCECHTYPPEGRGEKGFQFNFLLTVKHKVVSSFCCCFNDYISSVPSLISWLFCFQGPPGPHGNPGHPGAPGMKVRMIQNLCFICLWEGCLCTFRVWIPKS